MGALTHHAQRGGGRGLSAARKRAESVLLRGFPLPGNPAATAGLAAAAFFPLSRRRAKLRSWGADECVRGWRNDTRRAEVPNFGGYGSA